MKLSFFAEFMLNRNRFIATFIFLFLLFSISSCRLPDPKEQIHFYDDFSRTELGENWHSSYDGWRIEDGWLVVENAYNAPLFLSQSLPEQVRITFQAKALSEEGDLKFEVFTDGQRHESGYICIFGGWSNRLNVLARLHEHGDDRQASDQRLVQENRVYNMAVERTDGHLRWYIDGLLFMSYPDSDPLVGEDHSFFAFNDWESPVAFDNFRIFDLSE